MRIYAIADIHSPRYFREFIKYLDDIKEAKEELLLLLAGDIIDRGKWHECLKVQNIIFKRFPTARVLAVFGNEEYDEIHDILIKNCRKIEWLNDQIADVEIDSLKIVIVGTRGVLDKPTVWQEKNIPNIREIYSNRLLKIEEMVKEAKTYNRPVLLLTHYPPRCKTLTGEKETFWSQMSSRKLAEIIEKYKVDIVVHGHLHRSIVTYDELGGTKIYNVSLPAVKKIVPINLSFRKTLFDFV